MYRGIVYHNGTIDTQDVDGHGTHVAGSLAGFGGSADGVAKHARFAFTDLAGPDGRLRNTETMGDDYYKIAYDAGARIHSDSWGYDSLYYGVEPYEVDHFVHANPFFYRCLQPATRATIVQTAYERSVLQQMRKLP